MTTLLALSGSLRAASTNTALLRAAAELAPPSLRIELYDYSALPLYNDDLGTPDAAVRLREAVSAADGVLISTPEYNSGLPGVLKNALDWASRPAFKSCFAGKPTAMMSATAGGGGGALAQAHLRVVLAGMIAPVFPDRAVLVGGSHRKFEGGRLTDETTRDFLIPWLARLEPWVRAARR